MRSSIQTTDYTYDGNDDVLTLTAEVPGGNNQVTQYVYGVGATAGVDLFSNDLIQKIEYPDPTYGTPSTSCSGWQTFGYNYQGDETSFTDQNGTTHQYDYDVLDRLTADVVTALGAGVDGAVLRLGYNFNSAGLPDQQTTYSDAAGSHVVNQVQDEYNGYGQLIQQYQEHSGSVNPGSSVSVQYQYDQPSGANYSRLSAMIYPNGRKVDYVYNSGLDSNISRISELDDDGGSSAGLLQSYKYLGLGTIVQETDGNGNALTYVKQTGDTLAGGDGGDQYTGLDRFGRVIDQNWINVSTGASTDRLQYGYDADGNVLYKNNILYPSYSELYHANSTASGDDASAYDALNRLQADGEYGSLSASGNNGPGGTGLDTFSGTVNSLTTDVTGNITSGVGGSHTYNSANELTSGGAAYDNNGNMTSAGNSYVYNAWNQIVSTSGGGGSQTYQYDALGRRVYEFFYSENVYFDAGGAGGIMGGNVIEERSFVKDQYVWGLGYQNNLVLRDDNFTVSGSLGKAGSGLGTRIYAQQDATWSVTALVDASGAVLSRFYYSAYGSGQQYSADFSVYYGAFPNSSSEWLYAWQGGRIDAVTGNYRFGERDYDPTLQRWLEEEPFRGAYIDGTNLYQAMGGNPVSYVDPSGLFDLSWWKSAASFFASDVASQIADGLIGSQKGENIQKGLDDITSDYQGLRNYGYNRQNAVLMVAARRIPIASSAVRIQELQHGKSSHGATYNKPLSRTDIAASVAAIVADVALNAAAAGALGDKALGTGKCGEGQGPCFVADTMVLTAAIADSNSLAAADVLAARMSSPDEWSRREFGVGLIVLGVYGTYVIHRVRRQLLLKKVEEELAEIEPVEMELNPRQGRREQNTPPHTVPNGMLSRLCIS